MAGIAFGQTLTGRTNKDPYFFAAVCSAVGATLIDGSRLICKAGGVAWFVAPPSTQIGGAWANGQYNSTAVGDKCCVSEWGTLSACLSANVYNYVATEWFVPTSAQLSNPGYICRVNWGSPTAGFWTSQESDATQAINFCFSGPPDSAFSISKTLPRCVRAFRCVTY